MTWDEEMRGLEIGWMRWQKGGEEKETHSTTEMLMDLVHELVSIPLLLSTTPHTSRTWSAACELMFHRGHNGLLWGRKSFAQFFFVTHCVPLCVCVCTLNKRPSVEFSSFLYVVKKEAPTLHVFIWYNSFHNFLRSFQSEKVKQL